MAKIIFSRRHHPGSVALRTVMWSPWSHCGVIDGEEVIQAMAGAGVVVTPLAEFKAHASEWAVIDIHPVNDSVMLVAARAQVGKDYDYLGVVGIGLHRTWHEPDAWFCSELVAYALMCGGLNLFRLDADRITPQHLWMLNFPILEAA